MRLFDAGTAAVLALGLGAGLCASIARADVIKERQALMKSNQRAVDAISDFLKQGVGTADDAAEAARRISGNAAKIPSLFPAGSDEGDTRALPAIWENRDEFERHAATLEAKTEALVAAAESADKEAIEAAFGDMGRNGCGACHRQFRERRRR